MIPVEFPVPVEYLPTGDHAMLFGWDTRPPIFFLGGSINAEMAQKAGEYLRTEIVPKALLCLEDGRAVLAGLDEIKFEYRYDHRVSDWADVSGFGMSKEDQGGDADQAAADHGGPGVPGDVSEPD